MINSGPNQNFVQVRRDFSDLEEKMEHLLSHPEEAANIARNSINIFRDKYLTPAAQACYWRKLVRGYGSVSFKPELYVKETDKESGKTTVRPKAMDFETYVILRRLSYE